MTREQYKEWWKRDDDITAEWLGQTSRWLGGMRSSDGSVIVTHNENGINLQVGPGNYGIPATSSATPLDGRHSVTLIPSGAAATAYMQLVNDVAATANAKRVYGISDETPPAKRWLTMSPTGVQVVVDNDYSTTTGELRKKIGTLRADISGTSVLLTCTAGTWTVFETAAATCT